MKDSNAAIGKKEEKTKEKEVTIDDLNASIPTTPTSPFDDPEYKEKIESKLEPLDIGELLTTGKVSQTVTLMKDLTVTFKTLEAGAESIADKLAYNKSKGGENFGKLIVMAQLASSIEKLNGSPLVEKDLEYSYKDEDKYVEVLELKYGVIRSLNTYFVGMLNTHNIWFEQRVFNMIKNGFMEEVENF